MGEKVIKIKITGDYKSIKKGDEFIELPDFCVLTGKNGSGKSHFLESFTWVETVTNWRKGGSQVCIDEKSIPKDVIKYIAFGGLVPNVINEGNISSINQKIQQLMQERHNWLSILNDTGRLQNRVSDRNALRAAMKATGKELEDLTEDDIRDNYDFSYSDGNIFGSAIANIFKMYSVRYFDNCAKQVMKDRGKDVTVLADEEFREKYGEEPWKVINGILKDADLSYQVNNPGNDGRDSVFNLKLHDETKNIDINPKDLSTGEKVLMSLALAIYNTGKQNNVATKILLLDEPDAPLHPQFSRYLLTTIKNYIVSNGVKVVMTTHSPTTVALAEEEWLYKMDKDKGRPEKTTKDEALALLCADIPSLRVSIDKQRVIFTESKYDAANYGKIWEYVKKDYVNSDVQLVFHPACTRDGSNCDDVSNLLKNLEKTSGVYGVVDYDKKNKSDNCVKVMGEGGDRRYTLENYVFDPMFIGLSIIRDFIGNSKFSKCPIKNFTKFRDSSHEDKQKLIDWVCDEILHFSENKRTYTTLNDEKFTMSDEFFTMRGHSEGHDKKKDGLEEKIKEKIPELNKCAAINKNEGDNALKTYFIETVIREYPEYLSKDFATLVNSFK